MNSVLLWVGGLLVAVLALLFAVPYAIDWNSYRGVFEEEASRLLGRDVRVGGRVDLRLLPKPYVTFEKIRIGDVGAMRGEPFFRAETFTLWLSIPPLLRGVLEANDVELDRPTLSLAVDERGEGNWRSLHVNAGALPFLPGDVSLQAVRIRDGSLLLRDTQSKSSLALTGIDGEFVATALTGPYRFRGEVNAFGERHEVRLGTGTPEADGKVRLKATVRSADSHSTYAVDGVMADLGGRPRLEGALTAKLPISPTATAPATGNGAGSPVIFDLQAGLEADTRGAQLREVQLGFEQDGRPQLLSGTMAAGWGAEQSVSITLGSRWLDLDRIALAGDKPMDAARDLVGRMARMLPRDGTSRVAISIDQVNLGGEPVSGVALRLVRRGETLVLEELSGLVPGNGRMSVQGSFSATNAGVSHSFAGPLTVRGVSLQRFLAWSFPGRAIVAGLKAEAPFALSGTLAVEPDRIAMRDGVLELAGTRLSGQVEHRGGSAPELAVTLQGDVVDVSMLAPQVGRLEDWRQIAGSEAAESAGDRVLLGIARTGLLKLDVRAGRLTDGETTLHDVTAVVSSGRERLDIDTLKLRTSEGLAIELSGAIGGPSPRRDGRIAGWISAPAALAAQQLFGQLGLIAPGAGPVLPASAGGLAPLEMGFTASVGKQPGQPLTLKADGTIAGARVGVSGTFDGGAKDWRTSRMEIGAVVESEDLPTFLARLHRPETVAERGDGQKIAGVATLKVAGANLDGLSALVDVRGPDLTAAFSGRARLVDDRVDVDGEFDITARNVVPLLTLFEPNARRRSLSVAAEGRVGLSRSGEMVKLAPRGLTIGGTRVAGEVSITREKATTRLSGRIAAARGSVLDLLGGVVEGRVREGGRGDLSGLASVWPDGAFDFSATDALEGRLTLAFARLDVAEGLELSDASFELQLAPGRIDVSRLEGRALGGAYSGRLLLERVPGGAAVALGGRLGPFALGAATEAAGAGGMARLEFEASGRAASPRGAVSVMIGRGRIVLADARIAGFAPAGIDVAADSLLDARGEPTRADLVAAVRKAIAGTTLAAGSQELAVEISEGAARIAPLEVRTDGGVVRNASTLDLLGLKIDSEWTLTSTRRTSKAGGDLPSISLIYVGPLKDVARLQPKVSVDALERELTVRRMERVVERLEALRRQDEARARDRASEHEAPGPGGERVIEAPLPVPAAERSPFAPPEKRPEAAAPARPSGVNRVPRPQARPKTLEEVMRE